MHITKITLSNDGIVITEGVQRRDEWDVIQEKWADADREASKSVAVSGAWFGGFMAGVIAAVVGALVVALVRWFA